MDKPDANDIAALMNADVPAPGDLRWDDAQLASCTWDYYDFGDMLYVHEEPRQHTVALAVGDYAWLRLRMDDETEVVGAFVEKFLALFLPAHPEFREGWERIVKPHLAGERTASAEEIARFNLTLVHRILAWYGEEERAAVEDARAGA